MRADEFSHPEGLALSRGRLIVADKDNNRLVCLNADTLTWAFAVGRFGSGPNELMCTPRARRTAARAAARAAARCGTGSPRRHLSCQRLTDTTCTC